MYAEKFDLERHIQYNSKVINITYADDYDSSGRWKITVANVENENETRTEVFDGVMVATGHHVIPLIPNFPGQESFKGQIMHTHEYKHADGFAGKRVLVLGVGNSGADACAELSTLAKVVYMATRRGVWVRTRTGYKGWPIDTYFTTRAFRWVSSFLPGNWMDTILETYVNWSLDHELYGLKPKHRISQQHVTTNDFLTSAIISGRVAVRPNVKEFTETGVIFEGSNEITTVDVVIFATGYKLEIPFVDKEIISPSNNEVFLYKNMYSTDLCNAHTFALIGFVQPVGSIHVTAEMQSRYAAALMAGKVKLPSREEMKRITFEDHERIKSVFYESSRHANSVDFVRYVNEIAQTIGCKPNMWKIALTDPVLWYHLCFNVFTAYQFRLTGLHSWPKARETIINTNERICSALKLRYPRLAEEVQLPQQANGHHPH